MTTQRILLISLIAFLTGCASTIPASVTSHQQSSSLNSFEILIGQGRFEDANSRLKTLLAEMPAGWTAITDDGTSVSIAYWDQEHFATCASKDSEHHGNRRVFFVQPSYSKAYFLLAYMSLESGNMTEAHEYINMASKLEPNHPMVFNEKGLILQKLGAHIEAVDCFDAVIHSKGCLTNYEKSRALRGRAISLIDLGRLDEAEQSLKESLIIAPNNSVALSELEYIRRIRAGAVPNAPIGISQGRQD